MMKKKIIIVGAGGHGKVVADAALQTGNFEIVGFVDDNLAVNTPVFEGIMVLGNRSSFRALAHQADGFIVAIGNNVLRKEIFEELSAFVVPLTVVHPFTSVAPSAQIHAGCMILAGAVIGAGSVVGENTIVNVQSLIDHDCRIGAHSHIAQGSLIGSACSVPESFLLPFGQHVAPYTDLLKQ
jgi:sugar O-acyltransferase (sialic acid O-acetyltransferase NeuD family)